MVAASYNCVQRVGSTRATPSLIWAPARVLRTDTARYRWTAGRLRGLPSDGGVSGSTQPGPRDATAAT